jgi:Recombination endonuclease VII
VRFRSRNLIGQLREIRKVVAERKQRAKLRRPRRGMTAEEFKARYDAQHGRCLIGGHKMDPIGIKHSGNTPCLDHSHRTGRDRGILCSNHNAALGFFRDSIEDMKAAIKYLSMYPTTHARRSPSHRRIVQYSLPLPDIET